MCRADPRRAEQGLARVAAEILTCSAWRVTPFTFPKALAFLRPPSSPNPAAAGSPEPGKASRIRPGGGLTLLRWLCGKGVVNTLRVSPGYGDSPFLRP